MPFAFLLLVLSVPLAGGRLGLLSGLRLQGAWLAAVALGLQVVMTTWTGLPHPVLLGLHAASYLLVGALVWRNRAVAGLLVLAAGAVSNAGTIALNGGTLPARPEALVAAGYPLDPGEYKNSGVVADPVLPWLGDVMATPAFLPFRNVISVGDLLILLGAAVLLHTTCRSRLATACGHGLAALRDRRAGGAATA